MLAMTTLGIIGWVQEHIPCGYKHTAWVKMSTKATCVGDKEHTWWQTEHKPDKEETQRWQHMMARTHNGQIIWWHGGNREDTSWGLFLTFLQKVMSYVWSIVKMGMWRCPHDDTRQTLIMMCWSPGLASWGACIVNFRSNKMWSLHRPGWRFEHNLDLGWSWWVLLVLVGLGGKCLQHFMPIPFKALHTECW